MPELRRDPVVGYWTIIATERGWRPIELKTKVLTDERPCPFCEGKESETPTEIFAIRKPGTKPSTPGWDVRSILSKQAILSQEKTKAERHDRGIYELINGVGHHEVIVETPLHKLDFAELEPQATEKVVRTYLARFRELQEDPRFNYALLFKNHGYVSGAARDVIRHARSQIIAMPIMPKRVKEELESAKAYFEQHDRCVFCDILAQEKNEGMRIVTENNSFFAFCPFASRSPFEMWILPKSHVADFGRLADGAVPDFASILKDCLSRLRGLLGDPPFNFVMHTAPFRHAKEDVYWKTLDKDYHWYLQISPRLTHSAGFEWGTGIHINPTPPEEAAALLREAGETHARA